MVSVRRVEAAKERARRVDGLVKTVPGLPDLHVTYDPDEDDGDRWRVLEPYHYPTHYTDPRYGRIIVRIPEGFTYNLASIPDILWPIIAPFELGVVSTALHDAPYGFGGFLPRDWFWSTKLGALNARVLTWSRAQTDGWFYRNMHREKIARWKRCAAYNTVRAVGWTAWQEPTATEQPARQ